MLSELTKEDILRMFAETDRRLDKRFEETDEKIKELAGLFTGQWVRTRIYRINGFFLF